MYYLINFIDTEILREETSNTDAYINADLIKMPTEAYKTSTIYQNINGNMSNLITFPLMVLFLKFTYSILYEKEHKIAQNLRNMGMSMTKYYLSWYLFYSNVLLVLSLIWILMIKSYIAPDANFFMVWFLYLLTGLYFMSMGLLITAFYSRAKPGVLCAIIVYFAMYGVGIAQSSLQDPSITTYT